MRKMDKPPYQSENGIWYTEALFYDRMQTKQQAIWVIEPIFTLFEKKKHYICAQDTFLDVGDPTGYQWAMQYLGNYNHWVRLMKTTWFPEAVKVWKEHLALKLQSDAVWKIKEIASGESSQALAAAKYVAEAGWVPKAARGRPKQEEIDKELKQLTQASQATDDDAVRIGLKVINGGKRAN